MANTRDEQVIDLEAGGGEVLEDVRREVQHLSALGGEHVVRLHGAQVPPAAR